MRKIVLVLVLTVAVAGCAGSKGNPVSPNLAGVSPQSSISGAIDDGPYRLWGEWTFYFNAEHTRVEAVPKREARFHLNALKFLEEYCANCLAIAGVKNNGDGTIDLTVKITHPFYGHPEYTGFDVKGIIMFDGSWTHEGYNQLYPYPEPLRISWRKLGNPQVLNADGFTLRWSPSYSEGFDKPIFNYWPGKYSNGTPTANLNAYLEYYTNEERHMFRDYGAVSKTYKIWLPPGKPVVAGYAVEACWEPPLKTPVIDPLNDFPQTANQPEAYKFNVSLNNGQPINDPDCCSDMYDPSTGYYYQKQWGGHTAEHFAVYSDHYMTVPGIVPPCGGEWPDKYCANALVFHAEYFPDGDYIGAALNFRGHNDFSMDEISYTVFEFTIDLK